MKKHLIALAVAAAVAAPAAMADTTLYGLAHASIDYIDDGYNDANVNVSSNSSRLGVKGSEKLTSGLSAVYQYEVTVNLDGEGKTNGGLFDSARNSFVGLSGGFGTALVGIHDTPMKMAGRKYDLFGDQIGDSRNVTRQGQWDERPTNVIAYVSPEMAGFQAIAAYVTDHNGLSASNNDRMDNNDADAWSVSLGYTAKMFDVTGAYEQHNFINGTDNTAYRVGAGVNFAGLRVNALYQGEQDTTLEQKVWGVGAGYTFGKNMVKAQYFAETEDSATKDKGSVWAVGYDYNMSKQTTVYAAYAQAKDGATSNLVSWKEGHGVATAGVTGEDNSAFSIGMKHKF